MTNLAANAILHLPQLRKLRNLPVLGTVVHRLSHTLVPAEEKVWAQVKAGPAKGLWLHLNPRTGRDYLLGETEQASQNVLSSRLQPEDVFYDLGANMGLFSLLAARLVGPSGKVFSFEPDIETARRLRVNVKRNDFRTITVTEACVAEKSCERRFMSASSSTPDRGTGKLVADGMGHPVDCVSLDDFCSTAPPPNAIKCDVEGAEVEVLRGAVQTLRAHRPWVLCETHSTTADSECRAILIGLDYSICTVDENHVLAVVG